MSIVDLAALAPVVDAKAFSPLADGFLYRGRMGPHTVAAGARPARTPNRRSTAKILGVILNKTDMRELAKYSDFGAAEHYRHRYRKILRRQLSDPARSGAGLNRQSPTRLGSWSISRASA